MSIFDVSGEFVLFDILSQSTSFAESFLEIVSLSHSQIKRFISENDLVFKCLSSNFLKFFSDDLNTEYQYTFHECVFPHCLHYYLSN